MPSWEILGKEKLNGFFQARLIYRKVKILDKMKKNNLKTGSKSEKKSKSKIVSTLQEDCQAFGLIFDIYSSLEEAFHFLLSFATPDGNLRYSGSGKVSFWNYIIEESEALYTIPPEDATWFIAASLIWCLKPKNLQSMYLGTNQLHIPR